MAKRRGNKGSIFQLPDGRWMATLSLGYRNGKRWRKVYEAQTRQEVQRKLTDALGDEQRGLPIARQRQTLGRFLEFWLTDVEEPK